MKGTALFVLVMLILGFRAFPAPQSDTLLIQLNRAIEEREVYKKEKYRRLESYHRELERNSPSNTEQQFRILANLTQEYKTFIYDSAFVYTQRLQQVAVTLKDPVRIAYAKNQLGFILLSSGMFKETLDSLVHQRVTGMPDSIRFDYYFILARAYYDLGDFDKDGYYTPRYNQLGNKYIDSAKSLCPAGSYTYIYLGGLKNLKNENNEDAQAALNKLLHLPGLTPHQLAVTASTLSYYYISRNQPDQAIPLLAQAAMADIRTATTETAAISSLAELLYKKGDVKDAYVYIQQAMDDALFYGARQRKIQVSAILPVIAAAKLNNVEEQRKLWFIYSTLVTVLSILVFVFAMIIFTQLKRRKIAERALVEANKIKEEYIGYYFNVNSEYLGKIEAFKNSIEMKLMTKKFDDIKLTVNNMNLKKEREYLYESFDKIFLKLFPDFVTEFNSLFPEQDRIVLKEGQLLNTELRIFALIRMGILDTEKISKILDYSINTIYNYKARVKGKSLVPNEEFEKRVMKIHAL